MSKTNGSVSTVWGLLFLGLAVTGVSLAATTLDGCKADEATFDLATVKPDAGRRNCDAEPNEWRVEDPGEVVVIDDAGTRLNLRAVWGTADETQEPTEPVGAIFAAGDRGKVLSKVGDTWELLDTGTDRNLTAVWGTSPVDVWVAGFNGTVLQYNGSKWTDRSPPLDLFLETDAGVPTGDAAVAARRNLWGIWVARKLVGGVPATAAVFVVGDRGTVLHFKDNIWSVVAFNDSEGSKVEEGLSAVWGNSEDSVFVVGDFGTVGFGNATSMSKQQTGIDDPLHGVWGRGANDVYAVGVDGTVLHRTDKWTEIKGAPKQVLRSVWGPPNNRGSAYIIGWDGTMLLLKGGPSFASGGSFFPFNCVTLNRLESIWGTMIQVPDVPDGGVADTGLDYAMKSIPAVWVTGVSGTVITGP